MNLEVGMYVRTKKGLIAKYINKNVTYEEHIFDGRIQWFYEYYRNEIDFDEWDKFIKNYAVKASHNIIDLIEEGDYVNGIRVNNIAKEDGLIFLHMDADECLHEDTMLTGDDIKTIVTKEQFESMKYSLEG